MKNSKMKNSKKMRLNLFISMYGNISRRHADEMIRKNKVRVNGKTVTQLPVFVQAHQDQIQVNGKPIRPVKNLLYIAFHKPAQTLTTTVDSKERRTVYHYLSRIKQRVFCVGRLDWNTEGLLLFTNDGFFSQKIQDPKSRIQKIYMAKLNEPPRLAQIEKLKKGVTIPGGRVKALEAQIRKKLWVRIVIQEGKNRQLHFMFEKIGLRIQKLKRIQIGKLKLGSLKKGEYQFLTQKDVAKIFASHQKKIRKKSPF